MSGPQKPRGPWVRFELERIESELDRMAVELRERGDVAFTVSHRKARQIALCEAPYVSGHQRGIGATTRALLKAAMVDAGMTAGGFDALSDLQAVARLVELALGPDDLLPPV